MEIALENRIRLFDERRDCAVKITRKAVFVENGRGECISCGCHGKTAKDCEKKAPSLSGN